MKTNVCLNAICTVSISDAIVSSKTKPSYVHYIFGGRLIGTRLTIGNPHRDDQKVAVAAKWRWPVNRVLFAVFYRKQFRVHNSLSLDRRWPRKMDSTVIT